MTDTEKNNTTSFLSSNFKPDLSDEAFRRLATHIQQTYGINLWQKRQLVTSRLAAPLRAKGYSNFNEFIDHLLRTNDQGEVTLLLDKLTTNYTFFMREQEHLEFFRKNIIPDLLERHKSDKTLSIWSAGCSTGEEPYNLTMYFMDALGSSASSWDTRILATDISNRALTAAKEGVYELPATVPSEWKRRYFTHEGGDTYRVQPFVRDNVIFQKFNLMDPIQFKRKFDLIFCRNVMIYFDQPTKDSLVERFFAATNPGGYFLISYSENLSPGTPYRRIAPATFQKPR